MRWPARDPDDWHRWFAWRPVTIDGARVWLETVERKFDRLGVGCIFYIYRLPGRKEMP